MLMGGETGLFSFFLALALMEGLRGSPPSLHTQRLCYDIHGEASVTCTKAFASTPTRVI